MIRRRLAEHHPEGGGAVAWGEVDEGGGSDVVGGVAFGFGAGAGAAFEGDGIELGAVGGEEDGALGEGEFDGGVEEIFEVVLDLPTAAVVAA